MTRQQLQLKLDDLAVDPALYALHGEGSPGQMVLAHENFQWVVFYYDPQKGKSDIKKFASEQDACNYFYRFYQLK